jgi:CRP/FNR family transcriptional regulator
MHTQTALPSPAASATRRVPMVPPQGQPVRSLVGERIGQTLALLQASVPITRTLVRAGDTIAQTGDRLQCLYVIHAGMVKTVSLSADGREQVVGLHFRGDWLGFDGIADGHFHCDAISMDTGEIWAIRYDALMAACAATPALMGVVHSAMSREIARDRDSMMSLCTLPADARVAEFLRQWSEALEQRGLRADQITLRLSRAEIGNYLGMKLETVSRALSRLARDGVIDFCEKGRRDLHIPDAQALAAFVQRSLVPATATLQ